MALHLSPPPATPRKKLQFASLTKSREDNRALLAGAIATLLLWPSSLWLASLLMSHVGSGQSRLATTENPPSVFSIELAPDEFELPSAPEKEPPPAQRFVETNPDAPENVPDETRNFAAQNQQAAQEVPTPDGKSDMPSTKGENPEETNQIVSGSLQAQPPDQSPPPPPPSPELMQAVREAQQQRERNPLAGEKNEVGESSSGYGFNLGERSDNAENIPQKIEGSKQAPLIVGAPQATVAKINPQMPQPRPRLETKVRPAVLSDRPLGTSNIGITAADARWSEYGQYLQRLIDSVQIEWERILANSKSYPPPGSTVKIKFRIDSDGVVSEIIETEANAGAHGTRACQSAITSRSPYGKWSDEMLAVLGDSQELTFTFLYH